MAVLRRSKMSRQALVPTLPDVMTDRLGRKMRAIKPASNAAGPKEWTGLGLPSDGRRSSASLDGVNCSFLNISIVHPSVVANDILRGIVEAAANFRKLNVDQVGRSRLLA